jgi:hypothetical protein
MSINSYFLSEDFRKLANILEEAGAQPSDFNSGGDSSTEGNEGDNSVNTSDDAGDDATSNTSDDDSKPNDDSSEDSGDKDESPDTEINDLMTKEKKPDQLTGNVDIKGLARDLGLANPTLFTLAFNSLKRGVIPTNLSQLRELATAFDRMLEADSATTSKVINKLRVIRKKGSNV